MEANAVRKTALLCILSALLLALLSGCVKAADAQTAQGTPQLNSSASLSVQADLPETMEECYAMLDEILSPDEIEYLKNATDEDLALQHVELGLWIRNNWLYPTQSRLARLLFDHGISDIDSMSALILRGYVAYLNGQPCSLKDLMPKGCPLPSSL